MARAYRRKARREPEQPGPIPLPGISDTFSQMTKLAANALPASPISTSMFSAADALSPFEIFEHPAPSISPREAVPLGIRENLTMEPNRKAQKAKDATDFAAPGEAKLDKTVKKKEAKEGAAPAAPSADAAVPATAAESAHEQAAPAAAKQYVPPDVPLEEVPHAEPETRATTRTGRSTVEKTKKKPSVPVPERSPVEEE